MRSSLLFCLLFLYTCTNQSKCDVVDLGRGLPPTQPIPDYHWLFLHYHKTGHDLTREILLPICKVLGEVLSDNKGPRRREWFDFNKQKNVIPYFKAAINVQGGAEMSQFDWNLQSPFPFKIVHFVRNPFDYVVSAYLYHAQNPPPPEHFVRARRYKPCVHNATLLEHYVNELSSFGENKTCIQEYIDNIVSLCKDLQPNARNTGTAPFCSTMY